MFERRLRLFLSVLLGVMCILLLRAVHLQVLTTGQWQREAEDFNKRAVYTETTRGRILDHNGLELAVDDGCMDACVDYRAISRNKRWIESIAAQRLVERLGDRYRKAPRPQRIAMVDEEAANVHRDIDRMWALLAEVSGKPPVEIDELCQTINLKVAMRSRYVQYKRYLRADERHSEAGPPPWYRRWLLEGGNGGPEIDDFEQDTGEQFEAHAIIKDIDNEQYLRLAKASAHCPGLVLRAGTVRTYPQGTAGAHLLGMLAAVTKEDLQNSNLDDELRKYEFTDVIGRGGLEGLLEPVLRGARGKVLRQSGRVGRADELIASPMPGRDVRTTIDIRLQRDLQRMFATMQVPVDPSGNSTETLQVAMHGAAVVIDVKTGYVRALASYPDFDPNELQSNFEAISQRVEEAPLMNRATQWAIEPGSTIKPVVGLAAITAGLNIHGVGTLTAHKGIECTGHLVINGTKLKEGGRCWVASKFGDMLNGAVAHHPIPFSAPHRGRFGNPDGHLVFADALERSCNIYFETIADAFGVEALSRWFETFGLGRETGIGIPEARGLLPDRVRSPWPSHVWFSGIGQGSVLATPIQMANVAATIARDGVWMRPRLIEENLSRVPAPTTRGGGAIADRVDLMLDPDALAACRDGMIRVVSSEAGTGSSARMKNLIIAGKTGTAEAKERADDVTDDDGKIIRDANGNKLKMPWPRAYGRITTDRPWYRGTGKDGSELNHAWFIGFAPAHDPQVAFAIMIEYGGSGSLAAQHAPFLVNKCIEYGYVK